MMRVEVFLQSTAIKILRQKLSQASFSAGESEVFPILFQVEVSFFFFRVRIIFYPSKTAHKYLCVLGLWYPSSINIFLLFVFGILNFSSELSAL